MRKTAISLGGALVMCLMTAMSAVADSSIPQPSAGPDVLGTGGTGGGAGGTAFTGSTTSLALIALAVFIIAGASLLALRRLRSSAQ
jgi:hypothetical protein